MCKKVGLHSLQMLAFSGVTLLFCLASTDTLQAQKPYVEIGTASFYHDKFVGRMTANGEIFSQDSMTAAHKSIALGSYVLVTNLSNDSSVVLRVNDRMPKWNKRSIDLSFSAAEKLNYIQKGLTKVRIEVIPPPEQEEPAPNPGPLAVERVQPSKSKTVFKVPGRQIFLKRPVIIYHTAYKQMGRWKLFSRASND